ncbi:hypothetical protein EDD36DRAFT_11538 [Exophiala viscosa]|uniref:Uncharacterized protein n=1 Tax=Exophiala viscosa TaxID=2486360 RepID=A0AAN6E633_9EURO|nr:hypothetical protein EDD36DRAFT_11538 [Exophiala viscosa]
MALYRLSRRCFPIPCIRTLFRPTWCQVIFAIQPTQCVKSADRVRRRASQLFSAVRMARAAGSKVRFARSTDIQAAVLSGHTSHGIIHPPKAGPSKANSPEDEREVTDRCHREEKRTFHGWLTITVQATLEPPEAWKEPANRTVHFFWNFLFDNKIHAMTVIWPAL